MYSILLYIHSYLRWAVLILGLYLIVRSFLNLRTDSNSVDMPKWLRQFVILFDVQVIVGVLLYAAFSPVVHQAMQNFGQAMKTTALRFWAVEHPTVMLLSLILTHVANFKVKRAGDPRASNRAVLIYLGIAVLLMLVMTPWPFGQTHRPLFRF
ncbi:MAG: hypothetical protein Q9P14_16295 [candidate division KSB1 bacterium]|nr:hypothetical protein [candidate division KSB1 bacterium]MDQ7062823.1 hypothetical protein [candidate division KSB1 bacterium]